MSRSVVQGVGQIPVLDSSLELFLDGANPISYPGQGSIWFDLSGKGNNFTLNNAPTKDSTGFTFNGTNQWAGCSNTTCGNFGTGSFTIEYGVNYGPLRTDTSLQCIISKRTTTFSLGVTNAGWIHRVGSNQFYIMDNPIQGTPSPPNGTNNSTGVSNNGINNFGTGSNTHIIQTLRNDGVSSWTSSLYRNGTFVNSDSEQWSLYNGSPQGSVNNTAAIRLMQDASGGVFLPGKIFFVRLYNRVLTEIEIKQSFEAARSILQI